MNQIHLVALAVLLLAPSAWAQSCADQLKEIQVMESAKKLNEAAMKIVEESRAKAINLQNAGRDGDCVEALYAARVAIGSKSNLDDTPPKND